MISSENPCRRGWKTPPIHLYEDRRDFLVPLIFMAICDPKVHGDSSESKPHPHPNPPLEGEGIN
ncbi:MAG: hypothetical protein HZA08_01820 [Nitrospirae bacterium]|nr:hypothetical protein [Nitrospirota bacterium]